MQGPIGSRTDVEQCDSVDDLVMKKTPARQWRVYGKRTRHSAAASASKSDVLESVTEMDEGIKGS